MAWEHRWYMRRSRCVCIRHDRCDDHYRCPRITNSSLGPLRSTNAFEEQGVRDRVSLAATYRDSYWLLPSTQIRRGYGVAHDLRRGPLQHTKRVVKCRSQSGCNCRVWPNDQVDAGKILPVYEDEISADCPSPLSRAVSFLTSIPVRAGIHSRQTHSHASNGAHERV